MMYPYKGLRGVVFSWPVAHLLIFIIYHYNMHGYRLQGGMHDIQGIAWNQVSNLYGHTCNTAQCTSVLCQEPMSKWRHQRTLRS